jgi:hypothetical protein
MEDAVKLGMITMESIKFCVEMPIVNLPDGTKLWRVFYAANFACILVVDTV